MKRSLVSRNIAGLSTVIRSTTYYIIIETWNPSSEKIYKLLHNICYVIGKTYRGLEYIFFYLHETLLHGCANIYRFVANGNCLTVSYNFSWTQHSPEANVTEATLYPPLHTVLGGYLTLNLPLIRPSSYTYRKLTYTG